MRSDHVPGPSHATNMRFVVVVPMHSMEQWIAANIRALQGQTNRNFVCFIGDDMSTDGSVDIARQTIGGDPRFTLIEHSQRKFSIGNIYSLIEHAQPSDDDVVVLVDGDDRLAHPRVLERLVEIYRQHDCWLTYGSFSGDGVTPDALCGGYPALIRRFNWFRLSRWRASHLKTFKYGLWAKIPKDFLTITEQEVRRARRRALLRGRLQIWRHWREVELRDLLDPSGVFAKRCSDKNMMIPMLELAGTRSHFIGEILYIYQTYEKDLGFGSKVSSDQRSCTRLIRDILRHKRRLRPLRSLS